MKDKIVRTLAVSALLTATLVFFAPSKIYLTNALEFDFVYRDLLLYIVPASLVSMLIMTGLLVILPDSFHRRIVALLCAIAAVTWIQGNMLVWHYGLLDGKPIDWDNKTLCGIIDIAFWLLAVCGALAASAFVNNHIKVISLFFIVVQILSTVYLAVLQPDRPSFKEYSIKTDTKFNFSRDKNVIILILDGFQADIFQEIVDEDRKYETLLDGFTFFRNALAGYPTTKPSIPFLLTSNRYDNAEPYEKFLKKAYLSDTSILHVLKKDGFRVEIYPLIPQALLFSDRTVSNLMKNDRLRGGSDIKHIYLMAMFRYLPHFAKRVIYTQPALSSRMVFPNTLDKNVAANSCLLKFLAEVHLNIKMGLSGNNFKFYHIAFPHPPLRFNEKLEAEKMEFNRKNFKRQGKATLETVGRFLDGLKKVGAYDRSMICIVADHGSGLLEISNNRTTSTAYPIIADAIQASALPLMLIKKIGATGPLKISDAPVSLSDLPYTIFADAAVKHNSNGRSMFQIEENELRERKFLFYAWTHGSWNKKYLPEMKEFVVSGHSWLSSSWDITHLSYAADGALKKHPSYSLGKTIPFGLKGDAGHYKRLGWNIPEKGCTWTQGGKASLRLIFDEPPQGNLTLRLCQQPFILHGKLDEQRVNVVVNQNKIAEWHITAEGECQAAIPQSLVPEGTVQIDLELPDAAAPSSLTPDYKDERELAICVKSLTLD